jgi:hypothetical protein
MRNRRKGIETAVTVIFVLLFGALLIIFARDTAEAVRDSIISCLTVIIPSLYAFCVLSSFIISAGIYKILSRPFEPIARYILHIPPEMFSVFLLSCFAGYPIGAKMLSAAYKEGAIDSETAADMQCYTYMGGPAYFCGAVSVTLFGSIKLGLLLFGVIFTVNLLCGIIMGLKRAVPEKKHIDTHMDTHIDTQAEITVEKFLSAVTDGGKSILAMCGIIVFFAAFACMLDRLGFFTILGKPISELFHITRSDSETFLRSVVEINNILRLIPGKPELLPAIAGLLSFGGICVITQVMQFAGPFFKPGRFMIYRLCSAALTVLFTKAALIFCPSISSVLADTVNGGFTKGTAVPSVLIIIMSVILLTFDTGFRRKKKNMY